MTPAPGGVCEDGAPGSGGDCLVAVHVEDGEEGPDVHRRPGYSPRATQVASGVYERAALLLGLQQHGIGMGRLLPWDRRVWE